MWAGLEPLGVVDGDRWPVQPADLQRSQPASATAPQPRPGLPWTVPCRPVVGQALDLSVQMPEPPACRFRETSTSMFCSEGHMNLLSWGPAGRGQLCGVSGRRASATLRGRAPSLLAGAQQGGRSSPHSPGNRLPGYEASCAGPPGPVHAGIQDAAGTRLKTPAGLGLPASRGWLCGGQGAAGALLPLGGLRSRDAVSLAQPSLTRASGLGAAWSAVCCVCPGRFLGASACSSSPEPTRQGQA